MGYSVAEFSKRLGHWEDEHFEGSDLFMEVWYHDGVPTDKIDEMPVIEGFGQLEVVDRQGGEGDGAEISVVIKAGDRYFRKTGYYSSWGESEMDSAVSEVQPVEVTRTEYEEIA